MQDMHGSCKGKGQKGGACKQFTMNSRIMGRQVPPKFLKFSTTRDCASWGRKEGLAGRPTTAGKQGQWQVCHAGYSTANMKVA
eukprot:5961202-Amphidinium_carterae.1